MDEARPNPDSKRGADVRWRTPAAEDGTSARRARGIAVAVSILAIAAIGSALWYWQWSGAITILPDVAQLTAEKFMTIEPQPVSLDLNVVGRIGPVRSVAVVAPFDGVISERKMQVGDAVAIGDVLLVLDAGDITSQYRAAQSAFLKAQMAVRAMEAWESSPEVLRAKRSLEASEQSLASTNRQIHDMKGLFDQGIVSRNEYEGLLQQRDSQQSQVEGNRLDMRATLERGNADNRQLLELDLQNATAKLGELKQQLSGAKIAAGASGILASPPPEKNAERISIEPGARVARGAPLFAIADTTSFVATGMVDEVDVNRIKLGQPVIISSDAISGQNIPGKIVSVSAEAVQLQSYGQPPSFQVRVSFVPENKKQRQAIRLGMSARISIRTYHNLSAVVVPPTAIKNEDGRLRVTVVRGVAREAVAVTLGERLPMGVEVLSGLAVGDTIIYGE
ncbi:efflux RND transporter periplasmic adaptor subunit [Rhizobium sp. BR 314]|uniref:efflux RND transporter periplasmic adaptor subunit n=1 Tax=Rhizobium sp. BR 314 TaxID=3040013 RepID=UPI0039BFE3CE